MWETLLIWINTEFDWHSLGTYGLFETQNVLTQIDLLHTDLMNIFGDKMTGAIIGRGGSGGFKSGLLEWREDEDDAMEKETQ